MRSCVEFPRAGLEKLCEANHIRRLSVFGSALRADFGPDSDLDVLVEFEAGETVGLRIVRIERDLSALAGRSVDLRTPNELSRYFRDRVMREAEPHYVRP